MINEKMLLKGTLTLTLTDANGQIVSHHAENMIVTTGLSYIASRMRDATATVMSHMAIGSGTVAAATANSGLGTELGRTALTGTTIVTTNVANDSVQYAATFGAGVGTGAVTEAGLFNAASAGVMLSRTVFPVINKGALDTLTVTWKVTAQ
jgi:hypothetical protein